MQCEQCDDEFFGEPALLNIHGMVASKNEPACWGHSYEDDWWPCPKKTSEEHVLIGELREACEVALALLRAIGRMGSTSEMLETIIAKAHD
jgi:hypothetical protein